MITRYEHLFSEWSTATKFTLAIIVLVVVLGLAGLLGRSGFAQATVAAEDQSFRVEYDRLPHKDEPVEVRIVFATSTTKGVTALQVELDNELMKSFDVKETQPSLAAGGVTGRSTAYVFRVLPDRSGEVSLTLVPKAVGVAKGSIRIENSQPAPVSLFILP